MTFALVFCIGAAIGAIGPILWHKLGIHIYHRSLPTPTTPRLAEFVDNFREFVLDVEGEVPPDVEQALAMLVKLERSVALLQPPAPTHSLPTMPNRKWVVVIEELTATAVKHRILVLEEWSARYAFTLEQRAQAMHFIGSDDQPRARKLMQIVD